MKRERVRIGIYIPRNIFPLYAGVQNCRSGQRLSGFGSEPSDQTDSGSNPEETPDSDTTLKKSWIRKRSKRKEKVRPNKIGVSYFSLLFLNFHAQYIFFMATNNRGNGSDSLDTDTVIRIRSYGGSGSAAMADCTFL